MNVTAKWPDGEWNSEPDQENFKTAEGLDASIVRHSYHGHLCGYVGVPATHKLYGEGYDRAYDEADVDVHGGLTYADKGREEYGEDTSLWYFGFDCAHSFDLMPRMLKCGDGYESTYRNIEYVRRNIASLSKQLAAAGEQV